MYRIRYNLLSIFQRHFILKRTLISQENIIKSPGKEINFPENILLQDYLFDQLRKWGDKVAVECIQSKRSYTYQELRKKSLALAYFFKNSLKLKEKTTVGILLPNLPEYPIIILGALQAGLIISTINPSYNRDEIKRQLVDSNSKILITLGEVEQEFKTLGIPILAVKNSENSTLSAGTVNLFEIINSKLYLPEDNNTKYVAPDDTALLPYSSGTTGLSKGVQLTHKNLVCNLEQTASREFSNFSGNHADTVLSFLPFFHIYGLTYVLFHGLSQGAKLISFPKFTNEYFLKSLKEHRPTFIPLVPPIVHLINTSPLINPSEDLSSVQLIMSGAAPLGATDVERFCDITNGKVDVMQAYGLTEASPLVTKQTNALKGGLKIGSSGFLVPNTEAKFISLENSQCQRGLRINESGEFLIRGPQVMKGYLNNPKATRETITEDGWLKTGDIGHYDEEGHIYITDRLKELIKVKGFQVAPAELEAILRNHPLVQDVAVIGVEDKRLGEAPKAFIVPKKDVTVRPEEIQEFISTRVAKFKQLVGGVEFIEMIPRNPSGKILRRDLKKLS